MTKVYKYILEPIETQEVEMPKDSKILGSDFQLGRLCLWALVEPKTGKTEKRIIRIYGTGHDIVEQNLTYIATAQQLGGHLIWHVFEEIKND